MANYALKAHNLRILLPSHCCTVIFPHRSAGGAPPWMLNKKMDEALIFTSTHATLYTTRPFPCISEIADLTVVERPLHDALFTSNSMLY